MHKITEDGAPRGAPNFIKEFFSNDGSKPVVE